MYCPTCQRKHVTPFDEWAASVGPGSHVYLQPYAAWRGLSHSQYLVLARDGDALTVQVLGVPQSRMTVEICHAGQHDLTPLAQRGAAW